MPRTKFQLCLFLSIFTFVSKVQICCSHFSMEKYHGHAPWAPEIVSESCNFTNGDVRLVDLNFAVWKVLEVIA